MPKQWDRFAGLLAVALGFSSLMAEPAPAIGLAPLSYSDLTPTMPGVPVDDLLAQADDLAPPPSPEAIVTTPPPAPLAEAAPPPLPGYAWDPGHWTWDGGQYVWEPGKYIMQPTNGATFTPGYWQHYSGGWAWVVGRWRWGTQGEGE